MNISKITWLSAVLMLVVACQKPPTAHETQLLQGNAKNHGVVIGMARACNLNDEANEYEWLYKKFLMEKFGVQGMGAYGETKQLYSYYAAEAAKLPQDCAQAKQSIDLMTDVLKREVE